MPGAGVRALFPSSSSTSGLAFTKMRFTQFPRSSDHARIFMRPRHCLSRHGKKTLAHFWLNRMNQVNGSTNANGHAYLLSFFSSYIYKGERERGEPFRAQVWPTGVEAGPRGPFPPRWPLSSRPSARRQILRHHEGTRCSLGRSRTPIIAPAHFCRGRAVGVSVGSQTAGSARDASRTCPEPADAQTFPGGANSPRYR